MQRRMTLGTQRPIAATARGRGGHEGKRDAGIFANFSQFATLSARIIVVAAVIVTIAVVVVVVAVVAVVVVAVVADAHQFLVGSPGNETGTRRRGGRTGRARTSGVPRVEGGIQRQQARAVGFCNWVTARHGTARQGTQLKSR